MKTHAKVSITALTAALLLGGICAPDAHAQRGDKPAKAEKHGGQPTQPGEHGSGFSDRERAIIVDYFRSNPQHAKPLPPGIAKNYARGKPLPPGIAKRYLPDDLLHDLPPLAGYERMIIGEDVVLVDSTTRLIVDIISQVLR